MIHKLKYVEIIDFAFVVNKLMIWREWHMATHAISLSSAVQWLVVISPNQMLC